MEDNQTQDINGAEEEANRINAPQAAGDAPQPRQKSSFGESVAGDIVDSHDGLRVADNISGGRMSKAVGNAVDNSAVGKTVNKVRDGVEDAKEKAVKAATRPLKEAGKKVADQAIMRGGELAAKAGITAAEGAATGGLATAAMAATEAAAKAKKASDDFRKKVKTATGGLVDIDAFANAKEKLGKYWKENKWKIIGGSCIVFAILMILPFILIVAAVGKFLSLDTTDTTNQKTISSIESLQSSEVLSFTNSTDVAKIKNGDIGQNSVEMINYLAKRHQKIQINYNPKDATASTVTTGQNEPYEFDVVSADEIKCTDTTKNTEGPSFPINLSSTFNWSAQSAIENPDNYLCAVSYFPKLNSAVSNEFSKTFGPGEFRLSQIQSSGPMATQEKMAEVTSEAVSVNSNLGINVQSDQNILPNKVVLDSKIATAVAKSGVTVADKLAPLEKEYYPNIADSKIEGIIEGENQNYGVHIAYL